MLPEPKLGYLAGITVSRFGSFVGSILEIIPKLHLGSFGHNSEKNVQKRAKCGV